MLIPHRDGDRTTLLVMQNIDRLRAPNDIGRKHDQGPTLTR